MSTIISSTGILNISGSNNKSFRYSGGSIYNHGTINWTGTGSIYGASNSFINYSDGVFNIKNDAGIYYDYGGGSYLTITNSGSIVKSTATATSNLSQTAFNNNGTLEIQSGNLSLGSGTSSGTFNVGNGSTLSFTTGTHSFGNSALFTNSGIVEETGGTCQFTGTGTGSTINSGTTFNFKGGSIEGGGKLIVSGIFNWSSTGSITLVNTTVSSSGTLNIIGTENKSFRYSGGKIYNYGTINWIGSGSIFGASNGFENKAGGVFDIQTDAGIYYDGGGGSSFVFNNAGTIRKSAGTGTFDFSHVSYLNNTGTIEVEFGTLKISQVLHTDTYQSGTLKTGTYNIKGTLKFKNANILTNNATIILDGASAQILNSDNDANALASFTTNGSTGSFTLRNGKNFSTNASTFTNNGTLDFGTNVFSGSGNFTHSAGATLLIGSPDGITASSSSGNIQSSGTRSYSSSANYTYNGTSAQVTGDGLPSAVINFTINNSGGVTLTSGVGINGTLNLTIGNLTTGANTITLGNSTSNLGTLSYTSGKIVGNFKRWFDASTTSNTLFPIGTSSNYRPINLSFTSAPTSGGTLLSSFNTSAPGTNGLPLDDGGTNIINCGEGYWILNAGDGLTGGTYNLDLTADAFSGVSNYQTLRILKRNTGGPWTLSGTHSPGTGSNATPIVHRTGMTGFSEFGIGGALDNNLGFKTLNLTLLIEGLYNNSADSLNLRDTVKILIKEATAPYTTVDSATGALSSNGSLTIYFSNVINDHNYYIVVKHRNSIETWSGAGNQFTNSSLSYNFTTSSDKAYGNNMVQKGSKWCIYSGDVNQDGQISLDDLLAIDVDNQNFETGYRLTDINGDGQVSLDDLLITDVNNQNFVSVQKPGAIIKKVNKKYIEE